MQTDKNIREGFIVDYISGQEIKATPEEVDAVQVFSKQLIEDYGYPRENIQTRPQFRVKVRPSDTKKEYPVDIAVFNNEKKQDDDAYIILSQFTLFILCSLLKDICLKPSKSYVSLHCKLVFFFKYSKK